MSRALELEKKYPHLLNILKTQGKGIEYIALMWCLSNVQQWVRELRR